MSTSSILLVAVSFLCSFQWIQIRGMKKRNARLLESRHFVQDLHSRLSEQVMSSRFISEVKVNRDVTAGEMITSKDIVTEEPHEWTRILREDAENS